MDDCNRYSNWVDPKNDTLDSESIDGSSWQAIHTLQEILKQANCIHKCLSLFPARRNLMDDAADLRYLFEIVDFLESRLSSSHDQAWMELVHARLMLARYLLDLERSDEVSIQLDKTESTLNSLPWIRDSDAPRLWLRKLQVSSRVLRSMENLPIWLSLASTMQENEDTLEETSVLLDVQSILYEVDGLDRDSSWATLNAANLKRLDEINATLGNAQSVSHDLSRFGKTDSTTTTASEYLHRLRLFESRFKEFDVPLWCLFMYQTASDAALKLANTDSYLEYEAKMSTAWANCPTDIACQTWYYRGKNPSQWPLDFFVILHQWMKLDFEKGSLSALEVAQLLLLDLTCSSYEQSVKEIFAIEFGPSLSQELADRMYGAADDPVDAGVWELHLENYEKWLWDRPAEIDRSMRHTILLDMQEARNAKLRDYHSEKANPQDFINHDLQFNLHRLRMTERSRTADLRTRVDKGAVGANQHGTLTDKWHLMSLKNNLANSVKAVQDGVLKDDDLHEVQTWMEQAYRDAPVYFKSHRLLALSTSAKAMQHRYNIFGTMAPDAALDAYVRYDETYVGLRRERSILRGPSNLLARVYASPSSGESDHYLAAMVCCVEASGPARLQARCQMVMGHGQHRDPVPTPPPQRSNDSLIRELIDWAQKRKARSVTEVLGAEIIIPQRSLAGLDDDGTAMHLLRKEAELQMELDSKPSDPIELSNRLEEVRREMRSCPNLQQVMDLRDGVAITSGQIQALSQSLGPHVVMVDYIHLPSSSTAVLNEILCMIYKNGLLISSNWITPDLDYAGIKRWIDGVFFGEDEPLSTEDANANLLKLSPLISGVLEATEPGDTILLCPTGILFKIPFHAIPVVDDQPLIERNPIIYTQSFTIFYISILSASSMTADSPVAAHPLAIQALSDADSALPSAPTMAFVHKLNGARLLSGPDLNKSSFLEAITRSSLIHFYGHVSSFDADDDDDNASNPSYPRRKPLDHHSLSLRAIPSDRVSARDLFDVRLRSGAHVSLIGCKSGSSHIVGPSDDQLGLATALLYAGAGSILTALWEIRMRDAELFQEGFFEEVRGQLGAYEDGDGDEGDRHEEQHRREEGVDSASDSTNATAHVDAGAAEKNKKEEFLDLALALQKSMLKISRNEDGTRKAPYHWAAFMLQGDWKALPVRSFFL